MANTTNLNLEEINGDDIVGGSFIEKINSNNTIIDNKYGELVDGLLNTSGASDLTSAIEDYQNGFEQAVGDLRSYGNANASDILNGKTAVVQGEHVTGTALATATTASTNNVASGKTYYDNTGTLRTGTANFTSTTATASDVASGKTFLTSNGSTLTRTTGTSTAVVPEFKSVDVTGYVNSLTIPFTKTHNRVIVYACPTQTSLSAIVRASDLCLVCADTGLVSTSSTASLGCTFVSSGGTTAYVYATRNTNVSGAWNGTNYTITTSSNYYIGKYNSQTTTYYAIGL